MSKVEALAPGPAPQTANWRAQLPTLIRVYGIVLTLLLLLTVVTIGNPAFISQQNVFNMASSATATTSSPTPPPTRPAAPSASPSSAPPRSSSTTARRS